MENNMKMRIRNNIKEIIKSLRVLEEIKKEAGVSYNNINKLKNLAESINSELNSTSDTNNSNSSNRLESIKDSIHNILDSIKSDVNNIATNYTKNNKKQLIIVVGHINERINRIISEI